MTAHHLQIGPIKLPNRALLAPLSGITDRSFRRICEGFGAGAVLSEMVASAALACGQRDMQRRLGRPERLAHIVQLAGCEPEWMAKGAAIATEAGADMIDINMGCPAKRVTNGVAGSALMREPEKAVRLVEAVVGATSVPVSVKMRLGWNDQSLNAARLAKWCVEAGAAMITVHARTRAQFFKGTARWELVGEVAGAVDVPVVVNGDITSLETARQALKQSGAAAVMIGRGAQGRPWLVGQIGAELAGQPVRPAPTGEKLGALVVAHFEMMLEEYGSELGVRVARKHLDWYLVAAGIINPAARRSLLTQSRPATVKSLIMDMFSVTKSAAA